MDSDRNRVTVQEAARALGVTEQAVRKRIKRGSLDSDTEGNRVYVYLDAGYEPGYEPSSNPGSAPPDTRDELIRTLQDALAAEREANRENRRIIMQQAQNLAALEAPETRTESAHDSEEVAPEDESPQHEAAARPWWKRIFGR